MRPEISGAGLWYTKNLSWYYEVTFGLHQTFQPSIVISLSLSLTWGGWDCLTASPQQQISCHTWLHLRAATLCQSDLRNSAPSCLPAHCVFFSTRHSALAPLNRFGSLIWSHQSSRGRMSQTQPITDPFLWVSLSAHSKPASQPSGVLHRGAVAALPHSGRYSTRPWHHAPAFAQLTE